MKSERRVGELGGERMNNEVGGVAACEVGAGTSWMVGRYIIILDCQNLANVRI